MGIRKYINWIFHIVILSYMYPEITTTYGASTKVLFVVSTGWTIFIALGYYIFVYRLNRIAQKKAMG